MKRWKNDVIVELPWTAYLCIFLHMKKITLLSQNICKRIFCYVQLNVIVILLHKKHFFILSDTRAFVTKSC